MDSYPTPPGAAHEERMNPGFIKVHAGPVHVFTQAHDELFHCHPFDFTSHIIEGSYTEELLLRRSDGTYYVQTVERLAGTSHKMPAAVPHRLVGLPSGFCVTKADYGPTVRKSGEYLLRPDGKLLHRYWDEKEFRAFAP